MTVPLYGLCPKPAQDEIIHMAREAGLWPGVTDVFPKELERFAALVAEPWIETNKALAKEIIELKKQAEQRIPSHVHIIKQMEIIPEQKPVCCVADLDVPQRGFMLDRGYSLHDALYAAPVSIEAAVLAEREACAQVCDWILMDTLLNVSNDYQEGRDMGVVVCAAAIRARGEE